LNLAVAVFDAVFIGLDLLGVSWAGPIGLALAAIGIIIAIVQFIYNIFHPPPTPPNPIEKFIKGPLTRGGYAKLIADPPKSFAMVDKKVSLDWRATEAFIIEATNLAPKDINGYSDPYVKLKVGDKKYKTVYLRKNLNPRWDKLIVIPVADVINISVWDHDTFTKHDFLGCVTANISHLGVNEEFEKSYLLENRPNKNDKISGTVTIRFKKITTEEYESMGYKDS